MPEATPQAARIDRLVLQMPGGSADQGKQIAMLVAAGLAAAGALPQAGDLPHLRIEVSGDARTDPETLAGRIVEATLRQLSLVP
jgi:hypothetical protein